MRFWWVNHKQTNDQEVPGGYVWSPKVKANGAKNVFYDNMALVEPGDIVFSSASGRISAIGVAMDRASTSSKPKEFSAVGDYWGDEGWSREWLYKDLQAMFAISFQGNPAC